MPINVPFNLIKMRYSTRNVNFKFCIPSLTIVSESSAITLLKTSRINISMLRLLRKYLRSIFYVDACVFEQQVTEFSVPSRYGLVA